ncbi:MAG: hypothetical protein UF085_03750 [Collinsella sp.]|nr:hypothetical protein [Collinsella sp.]
MDTSIQNVSASHKPSIAKIAEGALLIAVAALAVVGIISFTSPSHIWRGEIPMFKPDLFDHPYTAPTAEDIVSGMETLNRASTVAAVLVALYPVYHAIWCLCAGVGCNCKAPAFCGRMSRRFGSLSACSLLTVLAACRGFECYIDGGVTGDKPLMILGLFLMALSIALVLGCVLACAVKRYETNDPGCRCGHRGLFTCFSRADVLLERASSNIVLLYGAELIACVASLLIGCGIASAISIIVTAGVMVAVIVFAPLCIVFLFLNGMKD